MLNNFLCDSIHVSARKVIPQSPLSVDPDVPKGTEGTIEDEADDLMWVDFGEIYGVVCC